MKMPDEPAELGKLTDDLLTRDFRVFQREKGHRFSVDDVATAFEAWGLAGAAPRALDLGTGLGSVMLSLAWKMPSTRFVGIEAQAASFELLRRNVERNSLSDRVTIFHGDLRDERWPAQLGTDFPLITGSPPYFPVGTAPLALDVQRAYARIEFRGGCEAYVEAASRLLSAEGLLVLCVDARAGERVQAAAGQFGLHAFRSREIIPRQGKAALFALWSLSRVARPFAAAAPLVIRDSAGQRTEDARALRAFSGLPEKEA